MKTRNILIGTLIVVVIGILLVLGYTSYNTDQVNKKLKEELYQTKAELEKCKESKYSIESERDNTKMALDEIYELFLTCQRGYGSEGEE